MESNKSTQISDIIGNDEEEQEQENELVQEIINEIQMQEAEQELNETDMENHEDIGGLLEKKVEEVPRSSNQINLDTQLHPVVPSTIDSNLNNPSKLSLMTSKLNLQTLKETLVVTSLLLVLSMKFVNKNITKLIPKLGNELGEINMVGLFVKALLGGIIFFIIKLVL